MGVRLAWRADRVNARKALVFAGIFVAASAVATVTAVKWSYASVVRRMAVVVNDLPQYGSELRGLEPYAESPSDRDPHERGGYSGPGWYVRRAPDGAYRAVTTSWGGFLGEVVLGLFVGRAFYHTVAVWDEGAHTLQSVVSIKESDPHSGIAHRYAWSKDSQALLIHGSGRLPEDYDSIVELCLVYLPRRDTLYRLSECPPVWQRGARR
jgi:hypothetical protein